MLEHLLELARTAEVQSVFLKSAPLTPPPYGFTAPPAFAKSACGRAITPAGGQEDALVMAKEL